MSALATPQPKTWFDTEPIKADTLNKELRDGMRFFTQGMQTSVSLAASQTIPTGTVTSVTWDTESEDLDNIIAVPGSTFTFTRAGVISLDTQLCFSASAAGTYRRAIIYLNGVVVGMAGDGPSAEVCILNLSFEFPIAVGDNIVIKVQQDSGVSLTLTAARNSLALNWVGTTPPIDNPDAPPPEPAPAPSPTPSPTPTQHTATFYPSWSRSYNGNGSISYNDTRLLWQGYISTNTYGNTRSLIGFDSAAIVSTLSGATNVSMTLTMFMDDSVYATATVSIGAHKYSAKPSTWAGSGGNVSTNIQQTSQSLNTTYTVTLSSIIVNSLKSGFFKGIAIGPGPTTSPIYWCHHRGALSETTPILKVTYYK